MRYEKMYCKVKILKYRIGEERLGCKRVDIEVLSFFVNANFWRGVCMVLLVYKFNYIELE